MNEDVPLRESTDALPTGSVQETDSAEVVVPSSAGTLLTAHREARGWTVEQVANQLNLAARQIDALEHDNYAALPGMVIVRGFIRAYAKLLQVDAAPILALVKGDSKTVDVLPPPRSAMSASFSETQLLSEKNRRAYPIKAIIGIVMLLLVAGVIVFEGQRMGWIRGTSVDSSAKPHEELAQTTEQPAPAEPNTTVNETEVSPVAQSVSSTVAPLSASAVSPATPAVASTAETKNPVAPPDGKNVLAIQAHQDSWIEIKRADNTVVASSLLKAGAAESFELTGPVSMVIGNAAGVTVTLRGAPVDVTGNSSNVARLNLK